jgi:hypothetical protein
MNGMLRNNYELEIFQRNFEYRLARIESEISHQKWKREIEATERSVNFWFGALLFTLVVVVIALTKAAP